MTHTIDPTRIVRDGDGRVIAILPDRPEWSPTMEGKGHGPDNEDNEPRVRVSRARKFRATIIA